MLIKHIYGSTRVLGAPVNWDEKETGTKCIGLPIRDMVTEGRQPVMVSAWEPTEDELKAMAKGATVYLYVWGRSHPPVMILVDTAEVKDVK